MSTSPFGSLKAPLGVELWVSDTQTKRVLRMRRGESAIVAGTGKVKVEGEFDREEIESLTRRERTSVAYLSPRLLNLQSCDHYRRKGRSIACSSAAWNSASYARYRALMQAQALEV